ncbi:hypothetical protein Q9966_016201, partial [Columba livia]
HQTIDTSGFITDLMGAEGKRKGKVGSRGKWGRESRTVLLLILFITRCEEASLHLLSQRRSLLAFLQLLPLAVSSVDPSYHFCYEGEHLTFLCMAKTMRKIGRFWFFNQTGEQIDLRSLYPLPTARLQLTATKVSAGECSSMCFMEDSGQEIPSKRSFPLTVEVQGRPG